MNPATRRLVPLLAAGGMVLVLAGCMGQPNLDSSADTRVVTAADAPSPDVTPERAAVVAEMRGRAEMVEATAYPDAFRGGRTRELAARPEPRSVSDVAAIQAELAAIARQKQGQVSPQELALLEARARELRRLAAQSQPGTIRR